MTTTNLYQSITQSQTPLKVGSNEYDVVFSFFSGVTTIEKTAKSYTENLFRIATDTGIDVLTLLETYKSDDKLKVTLTMAYYLNSYSDKTVLYGISSAIPANNNVARNILP